MAFTPTAPKPSRARTTPTAPRMRVLVASRSRAGRSGATGARRIRGDGFRGAVVIGGLSPGDRAGPATGLAAHDRRDAAARRVLLRRRVADTAEHLHRFLLRRAADEQLVDAVVVRLHLRKFLYRLAHRMHLQAELGR